MLRPILALAALLLLVPGYSGEPAREALGPVAAFRADPVPLFAEAPERKRIGALTYLGGVRLRSGDRAFGGFSAMVLEGDRFTLLSDSGNLVRFRLGPDWRPRAAEFGALPGGPGTGWLKEERDSESLTLDPESGALWVGFERANAVYRYAPGLSAVTGWAAPPAMAKWSNNSGPEAMVRLRDGSFLVIGEGRERGGRRRSPALLFAGDPTVAPNRGFRFFFDPVDDYRATDVAELPDGRLLVLVRRFALPEGFTARLLLVARAAIRPGALVQGREIARFAPPAIHDNFEAMALAQEGGSTILWLASDDNVPSLIGERSLLLKFRLELPPAR